MGITIDVNRLSVEERLQLMDELRESLYSEPGVFPLTAEQEAELDRRLDEIDAGDTSGHTWDEVVLHIKNRKR